MYNLKSCFFFSHLEGEEGSNKRLGEISQIKIFYPNLSYMNFKHKNSSKFELYAFITVIRSLKFM